MNHLPQIFDKLGLSKENGLFITDENEWKNLFSNRVERLIKKVVQPDAFFCIDNKPFILFFERIADKKNKLKEIWNFNESPVVIIADEDSVEIYNGFNYLSEKDTLQLFGTSDKLNDFSYFQLVTGKIWEQHQPDFTHDKRVDYHLLHNINATREVLISEPNGLTKELANSLLGQVIFVRYLIDRKVKFDFEQHGYSRFWTNDEFCELMSDKNQVNRFFQYLKKKFNGDLFPIDDKDFELIPDESFSLISKLLSGNEITTGQISLFNLYDFSIIPVEFISNVYELFIGQDEQEEQGAYYTPLFLVDYILSETVEKKFRQKSKSYDCKVLDPSCGSGIFLVETLRKIIEQYQKSYPNCIEEPSKYRETLKQLVCENIYGVDKDRSAINVAIFSIYLTLLDYQEPSDIESFRFPLLFGKNFFDENFFDTSAGFNDTLKSCEFDFILGNPPWKRGNGKDKKPLFVQYIRERRKTEKGTSDIEIEISNKEIAQAFVLRISDFCTNSTKIGLIATSKILYNLNGIGFRKYWLDRFVINKVFELAPVRKEVFDKSNDPAVGPAAVIFYQFAYGTNTDENIVQHVSLKPSRFFSLFKVFTIQRGDYKEVSQRQLKDSDCLWKVLVYGSYLDFNLIMRLKESYPTINELISNEQEFLVGQGAMVVGEDDFDASHLIGKPFLDTRKDIASFWVNPNPANTWYFETVHRPRRRELYNAPFLLVTGGTNKYFRSVSAVCEKDAVFKSSLTAIKSLSGKTELLRSASAVLNSSLFSYFALNTFSSIGIEREESHDKEKFEVPFITNSTISSIVSELYELKQKEYEQDIQVDLTIEDNIREKINELDSSVVSSFSFSEQEKDLLDFSVDITIPILMKHKGHERLLNPLHLEHIFFEEYAQLFFTRFNETYEKIGQKIICQIRHTEQIVGFFFKLVSLEEESYPITWEKAENIDILQLLSSLGSERITDRLFIQKDIRGFEVDGFYIVKPNERRLWHKAVAYLDLNEFVDAMLTTSKKITLNVQ